MLECASRLLCTISPVDCMVIVTEPCSGMKLVQGARRYAVAARATIALCRKGTKMYRGRCVALCLSNKLQCHVTVL